MDDELPVNQCRQQLLIDLVSPQFLHYHRREFFLLFFKAVDVDLMEGHSYEAEEVPDGLGLSSEVVVHQQWRARRVRHT